MIKQLKFLVLCAIYYLRFIVRFFPRNNTLWAFGAIGGFRDNPKYMFFDVVEHHQEIKAIWISHKRKEVQFLKNKGIPVCYWISLKGLYYALRAGVYVVDHSTSNINRLLEGGSYYVNLWHGCGIKRIRWQNQNYYIKEFHLKDASEMRTSFKFKILNYEVLGHRPDFLLAPSTIQKKEFFAPMMDIPEDRCVVGGYPRSRLMIEGKDVAIDFIKKYEPYESLDFVTKLSRYRKSYIYMPTWRNDDTDFIEQAGINWQQLNNVLKEKNELFVLKLHPFTELNLDILLQYSNICLYPKNSDVYTILPFIDCLITDYSSIYTDFLTMDKEIILFVFDYEEYLKGSYDLFDYEKYYIGKRANSFSQLLKIMGSGEDCHVPVEQRNFLMEFFWDNNESTTDIIEEIKKRISI